MWPSRKPSQAAPISLLCQTRAVRGPYTDPGTGLALYLVLGDDAWDAPGEVDLLPESLPDKSEVLETGTVSELEIRCRKGSCIIYAGDLVAGGKQDRTAASEALVVAGTSQRIPTCCVEHGRWHGRSGDDTSRFRSSTTVTPEILGALKHRDTGRRRESESLRSGSLQSEVWRRIDDTQTRTTTTTGLDFSHTLSPSSLHVTLSTVERDGPRVFPDLDRLIDGFPDAIGYGVVRGGQVVIVDIYPSALLLRRRWPALAAGFRLQALADAAVARPDTDAIVCRWVADARRLTLVDAESRCGMRIRTTADAEALVQATEVRDASDRPWRATLLPSGS